RVRSRAAVDDVATVAVAPCDDIGAVLTIDNVVAASADEIVVTAASENRVGGEAPDQTVAHARTGDTLKIRNRRRAGRRRRRNQQARGNQLASDFAAGKAGAVDIDIRDAAQKRGLIEA